MDQQSSPGWFRRGARTDDLAGLRAELAAARERAEQAERRLTAVRATADEQPGSADFGLRAEQILRLAESQAGQTRTAAAREAAALLERTHAEAETHRRRVAAELAARSTELERKAAEREAALDARERRLAETADAQRREIEELRQTSIAETKRIRDAVLAAADDVRRRAASEVATEMEHLRRTREAAGPGRSEALHLLDTDPDGRDPG